MVFGTVEIHSFLCHFFFFLSLEIYARANETSVAYDDTKDINTGKGNCFASNRCRSKCASSCNRDARGEMFSVKDYRCVRFRF